MNVASSRFRVAAQPVYNRRIELSGETGEIEDGFYPAVGSADLPIPSAPTDKKPQYFQYSKNEQPTQSIGQRINAFRKSTNQNNRVNGADICFNPRSDNNGYNRPNVLPLVCPEDTSRNSLKSRLVTDFVDNESDTEKHRQSYRQKVARHYKRLASPDMDSCASASLNSSLNREIETSPYRIGIDEEDWREIDHQRHLSGDLSASNTSLVNSSQNMDMSCESIVSSVDTTPRTTPRGILTKQCSPPSSEIPQREGEPDLSVKKKKKVRVRRHDSIIRSDSAPDLSNQTLDHKPLKRGTQLKGILSNDRSKALRERYQRHSQDSKLVSVTELPRAQITDSLQTRDPLQSRDLKTSVRGQSRDPLSPETSSESGYAPVLPPRRYAPVTARKDDYHSAACSETSDRSSRVDPQTYQSYAAGILHSCRKSEPFLRLQKHYSTLERIKEIEDQTQWMNTLYGRGRFNTLDMRSSALGAMAPQSSQNAVLLSKYKLENLWELKELYADLDEAQDLEEFFYDTKNLESIQWNAWKDPGLICKSLSIEDLMDLYEMGRNMNTKSKRYRYTGEKKTFKRHLPFRALCDKYQHLDEEEQKRRIWNYIWSDRRSSRRGSDASSSIVSHASSVPGTYLEIMESTRHKSRDRALYGYHINENAGTYESYIERLTKLSKSCPDLNKSELKARALAETESQRLRHSDTPPRRSETQHVVKSTSENFKQPRHKTELTVPISRSVDNIGGSTDMNSERKPSQSESSPNSTRLSVSSNFSPSAKSSESGYVSSSSRATMPDMSGFKITKDGNVFSPQVSELFQRQLQTANESAYENKEHSLNRDKSCLNGSVSADKLNLNPSVNTDHTKPSSFTNDTDESKLNAELRQFIDENAPLGGLDTPENRAKIQKFLASQEARNRESLRQEVQDILSMGLLPAMPSAKAGISSAQKIQESKNDKHDISGSMTTKVIVSSKLARKSEQMSSVELNSSRQLKQLRTLPTPPVRKQNASLYPGRDSWRKGSRPQPGAVLSALSKFREMEGEMHETLDKLKARNKNDVYSPQTPSGRYQFVLKDPEIIKTSTFHTDRSRLSEMYSKQSEQHRDVIAESSRDTRETSRDKGKESVRDGTVSTVKQRFEHTSAPRSSTIPKSALPTRSMRTALGRYEERIRSRSTSPPPRPKSANLTHQEGSLVKPRPSTSTVEVNAETASNAKADRQTHSLSKSTPDLVPGKDSRTIVGNQQYRFNEMSQYATANMRGHSANMRSEIGTMKGFDNSSSMKLYTPNDGSLKSPLQPLVKHNPVYKNTSTAEVRNLLDSSNHNQPAETPTSLSHSTDDYKSATSRAREKTDDLDDEILNDPSYGALGKWSGIGLKDGLNEVESEDECRGSVGSNDTLIIKSSPQHSVVTSHDSTDYKVKDAAAKYETQYPLSKSKSETNVRQTGSEGVTSNIGRTVSGDFKEIQQKYGAGDAFKNKQWLKDGEGLPNNTAPRYDVSRGSAQTVTSHRGMDNFSARDTYPRSSKQSYDIVRHVKPEIGPEQFIENLDTIDYEWKKDREKEHYSRQSLPPGQQNVVHSQQTVQHTSSQQRDVGNMQNVRQAPVQPQNVQHKEWSQLQAHSDVLPRYKSPPRYQNPITEPQYQYSYYSEQNKTGTQAVKHQYSAPTQYVASAQSNGIYSTSVMCQSTPALYSGTNNTQQANRTQYQNRSQSNAAYSNSMNQSAHALYKDTPANQNYARVPHAHGVQDEPVAHPATVQPPYNQQYSQRPQADQRRQNYPPQNVAQTTKPFPAGFVPPIRPNSAFHPVGAAQYRPLVNSALQPNSTGLATVQYNRDQPTSQAPRNGLSYNRDQNTSRNGYTNTGRTNDQPYFDRNGDVYHDYNNDIRQADRKYRKQASKPEPQVARSQPVKHSNASNHGDTSFMSAASSNQLSTSFESRGAISQKYDTNQNESFESRGSTRSYSSTRNYDQQRAGFQDNQMAPKVQIGAYSVTREAQDGNNNKAPPTPNSSFMEAYRAGFVGSLPRKRNPVRRHVSAVESLNLKSPPPHGKVFSNLIRGRSGDFLLNPHRYYRFHERSYSTPSSHSAPSVNTSSRQYSDSSLSPRQRRDEENARRRLQLEKYTEEQRQKKYEQTLRDIESRKHHDIYMDDRYWMDLAGVGEKETRLNTPMRTRNEYYLSHNSPVSSSQKSPIQLDRFGELDASAEGLQRPAKKVHTQTRGKARARYNFTAQNKKELSFRKGDTVYLMNQIDKNWYEGERHGVRGIFPINYVEILTSLAEAQAVAEEREGEARAKYNFTAQTSLELTLRKGDIVTLIRRIDENWYEGKIGQRQGIFPSSYVEICREPDTPLMTPIPSLAPTPVPDEANMINPPVCIDGKPPEHLDSFLSELDDIFHEELPEFFAFEY